MRISRYTALVRDPTGADAEGSSLVAARKELK